MRVQARSLAYLFIAGAALGLLTLVFPHGEDVDDSALVVLAGVATLIAAVMWAWADRLRQWQLHAALASGADAVIVDLEDAVAPDAKVAARKQADRVKWFGGGPGEAYCIQRGAVHSFMAHDGDVSFLAVATPGVFGPAYFLELAAVPSPSGSEEEVAKLVRSYLSDLGIIAEAA